MIEFACPGCREPLARNGARLTCTGCGSTYEFEGSTPLLVTEASTHAAAQAAWFDDEVDPEWEITRPHGSPRLHRWLLEEKFRRSISSLEVDGLNVLTVCAGSGMDAELLARAGADVVAADVSIGAAARTAERARRFGFDVQVVIANVEQLPFADKSFDVVYVHDGLHHLEKPERGLAEMARVARRAVCVTEPAQAAATRLAVRLGFALEREDSGNRVARLTLDDVRSTLAAAGFRILVAERYGMYYRHEPGRAVRLLSRQPLFGLAQVSFRLANALGGSLGNKLTVQAVREPE